MQSWGKLIVPGDTVLLISLFVTNTVMQGKNLDITGQVRVSHVTWGQEEETGTLFV